MDSWVCLVMAFIVNLTSNGLLFVRSGFFSLGKLLTVDFQTIIETKLHRTSRIYSE